MAVVYVYAPSTPLFLRRKAFTKWERLPSVIAFFFPNRRMVSSDDWSNRHRWIRFGAKVWCRVVVEASNTKAEAVVAEAVVAEVESADSDSMNRSIILNELKNYAVWSWIFLWVNL